MPEDKHPQKHAREPQALSSEYHKARKQLMLWAGILFAWELVGIDLAKASAANGNVAAIITAIRSPQAVPWVLVILVAYFLFKVTVEWHQCALGRRSLRASRVDFVSAWIVSLAAYVLYFGQALSRVQFADFIQIQARSGDEPSGTAKAFFSLLCALIAGIIMVTGTRGFLTNRSKPGGRYILRAIGNCIVVIICMVIAYLRGSISLLIIGLFIGLGCVYLLGLLNRRLTLYFERASR